MLRNLATGILGASPHAARSSNQRKGHRFIVSHWHPYSIDPRLNAPRFHHHWLSDVVGAEQNSQITKIMAEREGFEPPLPFRVCRFSRPVPSTTRPPLRL